MRFTYYLRFLNKITKQKKKLLVIYQMELKKKLIAYVNFTLPQENLLQLLAHLLINVSFLIPKMGVKQENIKLIINTAQCD